MNREYKNFALGITNNVGAEKQVICESTITHNLRLNFLMMSIELNSISNSLNESKGIFLYIKEGNQDWVKTSSFLIYAAKPAYTENLMLYLTDKTELTLGLNTKIALSISPADNGLLGAGDSLYIWGSGELFIAE